MNFLPNTKSPQFTTSRRTNRSSATCVIMCHAIKLLRYLRKLSGSGKISRADRSIQELIS